jgi:SAM-dependent methyltransferase
MDRGTLRRAQAMYAGAPWRDRLHVAVRLALCPFERLASFVPKTGRIVDLGCGHGVFANALALESAGRYVVGVERSACKLAAARATQSVTGRVRFVQGDALANPVAGRCRAILLIDVLYLLAPQQQEQALRACSDRLEPGGVLLLKTMDDHPWWKVAANRLEEWLAVRVLRLTLGGEGKFAFRPLAEWAELCQAMGFETQVVCLDRGYYHPHGAIVGTRR